MIDAEDAFERMGADVMRWQYCAQPPDRNLLFGFGPGARDQAQAADALELGQVLRRLREHRGLPADVRTSCRSRERAAAARPLARRRARTQLVARGDRGVRGVPDRRRDRARSRRSSTTSPTGTSAARGGASGTATRRARTLWYALVQSLRVDRAGDAVPHRAPVAEPRSRRATGAAGVGAPRRLARGGRAGRDAARGDRARCAASSSSAIRRARRRGSSCASRCGGSSSRARRSPRATRTRSPRSCA